MLLLLLLSVIIIYHPHQELHLRESPAPSPTLTAAHTSTYNLYSRDPNYLDFRSQIHLPILLLMLLCLRSPPLSPGSLIPGPLTSSGTMNSIFSPTHLPSSNPPFYLNSMPHSPRISSPRPLQISRTPASKPLHVCSTTNISVLNNIMI